MKFTTAVIAGKSVLGASLALGLLMSSHGHASAAPATVPHHDVWMANDGNVYRDVVMLTDIDINAWPICFEEDCSDQLGQTGIWEDTDTGNWYLEIGEAQTYLVVDDYAAR